MDFFVENVFLALLELLLEEDPLRLRKKYLFEKQSLDVALKRFLVTVNVIQTNNTYEMVFDYRHYSSFVRDLLLNVL